MATEHFLRAGPRQRQVLSLIARGRTDLQIGRDLGISVTTVRTYLVRLYRDNGFCNRTEAVAAWVRLGYEASSVPGQRIVTEVRQRAGREPAPPLSTIRQQQDIGQPYSDSD